MASQAYTHNTLKIICLIEPDQNKNEPKIIYFKNLDKLLSTIVRKFPFLEAMNDSDWSICINSQIMDKRNSFQFSSVLSTLPPPLVVYVITTPSSIATEADGCVIVVHLDKQRFEYKLPQDKDNWSDDMYDQLLSTINSKFKLYSSSFSLKGDGGVNIDEIEDIQDQFDDEEHSIDLFVNVAGRAEPSIVYDDNVLPHPSSDPITGPPQIPSSEPRVMSKMSIGNWLNANQLSDIQFIANATTLDGLLSMDTQTLWVSLNAMGLNSQQIARLTKALGQERQTKPRVPSMHPMEQKDPYHQQHRAAQQQQIYPHSAYNPHQPPVHRGYNMDPMHQAQAQQPPRKPSVPVQAVQHAYSTNPMHRGQAQSQQQSQPVQHGYNPNPIHHGIHGQPQLQQQPQQVPRDYNPNPMYRGQAHSQAAPQGYNLNAVEQSQSQSQRRKPDENVIGDWAQLNKLKDAKNIIKALQKEQRKAMSPQKQSKFMKQWEEIKIGNLSDNDDDDDLGWASDVSIDDVKDDGKHPVWPLIIPNNCTYDALSGRMTRDQSKPRTKLVPYEPALEFIRSISSKVATISIVGKARTGKSLVAGELYAPRKIPCPFDLGHKMDACTYGIWVSAKPVKHPHYQDTMVLIFDVEGTGYHEANKHNDMQLMVITLLISSYFIYNTKGAFDAPALDEIKFILELTKNIHTAPNQKGNGLDFKKFFPIFMWLLRDVHLEPVIRNKRVSVRQYFTQKVLGSESVDGFDTDVMRRQYIRKAFMQMFQKYDAFALPMPHGNEKVLKKLGFIARSKLQPAFNDHLDEFCDRVLKDTKCKVLFSKDADGEDQYTHCTGTHIAGWIEQCLEWINSDKIPEISSMTDAVMADVFRVAKKKAIKQYRALLEKGLAHLRNGHDEQPLEENAMQNLHLSIWNKILNGAGKSLQPTQIIYNQDNDEDNDIDDRKFADYSNDKPQIKVFREFCDEVGHHADATKIGQSGIMHRQLNANRTLSTVFCKKYLSTYFIQNIEPMLDEPKKYEAKDFLHTFTELENKFHKDCKGPSKDICWKEFKSKTMHESIQHFKRTKDISDKLLETETAASKQREEMQRMKELNDKFQKELELQKRSTKQELSRIKKAKEEEAAEFDKKLKESEQRAKDMKESQFVKLAETFQKSNDEYKKKLIEIQEQNKKEMAEMVKKCNDLIKATAEKQTVIHSGGGPYPGYPYIYGGGPYGMHMLPYSLIFSSPYSTTSYPGIVNTFEHLISDDATMCAAAKSSSNSFIEANLGGVRFVTHIEVKGMAITAWTGGAATSPYPCLVQYRNTSNQWITLRNFTSTRTSYMPNNIITTISISQHTAAVRILTNSSYAMVGTLRIYGSGGSPYPHMHQPHLVLYDDVMGASTVLQTFENEFLFTILPPDLQYRKYKLLIRGTVHGFAGTTFHSKCDNQGATITVVQSTNNHVFGGYTSLPWTSVNKYTNDTKSFVFLLRSQRGAAVPQKWNVSSSGNATYCHAAHGPTFGGGHDFMLYNNCNANNSSYANCPYSYKGGGAIDQNTLAGAYNFKVQDYEVWRVL
eukprot:361264_1